MCEQAVDKSSPSSEEGIRAIIALQGIASIVETREQAERGWSQMSEWERKTTIETYNDLKAAGFCE